MRVLIAYILSILGLVLNAQEVVRGKSIAYLDQTKSYVESRNDALNKAKISALESLGVSINRSAQRTVINNGLNTKTSYSSTETFSSLGIWVQTLSEKFTDGKDMGGNAFIECEIEGYALDLKKNRHFCDISFGPDSAQAIFKESTAVQVNVGSSQKGFTYIFANKVGTQDVSIVKKPKNPHDLDEGLEKPLEISFSIDNRINTTEEYRVYLLHTTEFIELGKTHNKNRNRPSGYDDLPEIDLKTLNIIIRNLLLNNKCCIEEENLVVIQ